MWPYLITIFLSCIFAGLAEYYYRFGRKRVFLFCSFAAISIGALLAGLRASTVGTDVMVYGNRIFQNARYQSDLLVYLKEDVESIEPLYLIFNFLASRFTDNEHLFYFLLQFFSMSFVYAGLVDLKKKAKIELWLGLFVYYMVFYGFSLNGMRQSVAISILFWGMRFIYEKKFAQYIMAILFAVGFHYSAAIFVAFYFIYLLIENSRAKELTEIAFTIGFILFAFGFRYFMGILAMIIPKYQKYLQINLSSYSIKPAIVRLPFLLLLIIFHKIYKKKSKHTDFWTTLLLGDIVFCMLRGASTTIYRMSYYFAIVKLGAYPFLCQAFNKRSQIIVKPVLILVLLIIWYYQVVMQGNDAIYPYASDVWTWLNG